MGAFLPKWKKNTSSKETLESLEKNVNQLVKARNGSQQCERSLVGILIFVICFSYPLLLLVGVVVWVWFNHMVTLSIQVIYAMIILLLPLMIYGIKKLINMIFTHRQSQYDAALKSLQEEKRKVLDEVMDKEPYRVARELLEKYDPTNPALTSATPKPQDNTTVRRRRPEVATPPTPHPSVQFQQRPPMATPRPSVPMATPRPSIPMATPHPSVPATPRPPQATPITTNNPGHTFIPPGYSLGPAPGPPNPVPILPRDRTTFDKIIDNLVGDGPGNRYALICSTCHSHNGMALKDDYEYLTFRCAYCYNVNPARKKKPSAVSQQPLPLPALPPSNEMLADTQDVPQEERTMGDEDTPTATPTDPPVPGDPSEHED